MMKKTLYVLSWVSVVIGLATGCKRGESGDQLTVPSVLISAKPPDNVRSSYQTESQFIIETILTDLAEQIYYTKYKRLPDARSFSVRAIENRQAPPSAPVFRLEFRFPSARQDFQAELKMTGPIWSPEMYENVMGALTKRLGVRSRKSVIDSDTGLLETLTDGQAATIENENQKLSLALEKDFTNPGLHEKAAILIAAFALREHSGSFFDTRMALCRMTAHLTMARYFTGEKGYGINGQIAEGALLTLMNNEAVALHQLDLVPTNKPALTSWARALRVHNTADYRLLDKIEGPSGIEKIERFWALHRCINTDLAWDKITDSEKTSVEFMRVAGEGWYSVGMGHALLQLSLPLEFAELENVYELSHGRKLPNTHLVEALNETPSRCFAIDGENPARVQIIGWGQWAMFFQRHLCHAIQHNFYFIEDQWGVSEEAQQFLQKCDQQFGQLRLYPFIYWFESKNLSGDSQALEKCLSLMRSTPQFVPTGARNNLHRELDEWHRHDPPIGTAYDPSARLNIQLATIGPNFKDWLNHWRELAPYDRDVSAYVCRWGGLTSKQVKEVYEPVLPYSCFGLEKIASTALNEPARYEELLAKAATLNPSDYFKLGDYFVGRKEEVLAAKYYEMGNESDPDSVRASNHACWLVDYYLKIGETNKARFRADEAAGTYSFAGLCAKAQFLEAVGDYEGALEFYSRMEERYDDQKLVASFCVRYKTKTGDTRFDKELQKRTAGIFPHGFQKAAMTNLQGAPTNGVLIRAENDLLRNAGLAAGDVIVAVYGIRVETFAQYSYARETSPNPELDLIVWKRNHFVEIKTSPPNHRFGVEFGDYPPN